MRSSQGFTLVEVLVSLAIFSMLIALLIGGYSQGLSLWERSQARSADWQVLENRHQLLRRLFLNAQVSDYRGSLGKTYVHFIADQQSLQFTSRTPLLDVPGYVRPVRIQVEKSPSGTIDLYYQEGGRHQDLGRGIEWNSDTRVLLVESLSDFHVRFLAPAFPLPSELLVAQLSAEDELRYRDNAEWLDWYDGSILWKPPILVEFNFRDKKGTRQSWAFDLPRRADGWSLEGSFEDV